MKRGRATIATHAARDLEGSGRPLAPPLALASAHRFDDLDALGAASRGTRDRWTFYRRYGHANGRQLEETVAALEGAEDALACSSGMAALATLFGALAGRGDSVVAARDLYGGTTALLHRHAARVGTEITFAPLEELAAAVRPRTRLVIVETISNPLVRTADLPGLAKAAHRAGAVLVVDNTFATPFLCRPLEWGAGAVIHSGTKLLNGHGDAVCGVICGPAERIKTLRRFAVSTGATVSPMDAWLTVRGMKTLGLRVERGSRNAEGLVRFLMRHRKVRRVHYPARARILSPWRGTMFSFELGGLKAADRFIRACDLVELVPSLGDVTTTASHPARSSHAYLSPAERAAVGVTDGLIRISTGIEDLADLLEDFRRALAKA